jgi:two-component system NarL family sensor kinase
LFPTVIVGSLMLVAGSAIVLALFLNDARRRAEDTLRALHEREAALQESHRENQALAGRLIVAQEVERRRIARDLHDDLSQKLALLNVEIDRLAATGLGDWHRRERRIGSLSLSVAEIARDVHDLSHELHPSKLGLLGLVPALDALCLDVSRKYGIVVSFHHIGGSPRLDVDASLHLYRIVQEALHNVVKHSGAKQALVELETRPRAVDVRVADCGCGFVSSAHAREGLGLISMRERARVVGGQIAIHSAPGMGTRLGVRVPYSADSNLSDVSRPVVIRSRAEIA